MQTKLTLRLDDELIREVKAIAGRRGQPISRIVANYFNSLKKKPKLNKPQLTPIVKSLKGALKGSVLEVKDYKKYLGDKYL